MMKSVYNYLRCTVLIAGLCIYFSGMLYGQCLNVPNGQWPSGTTGFTPTCSGTNETITSAAWTGEYSRVNVTSGVQYTFSSSVSTDFITISDIDGLSAYVWGVSPVIWTATFSGQIRFNLHNASDCTSEQVIRSRFILCPPPPPPANDECSGAIAIPTIPSNGDCVNVTVTTVGATGTADPTCTGTEDDDVWYTFTTPVGATIIQYVNTNISGNSDRVHQVYSGSSCGALTSIGCFDPESGSFTGLMGNTTYYLRTYTWGSGVTTTYNLCLRVPPPPPVNDECAGAIAIPTIPSNGDCVNVTVTTVGATGTADPTCTGTEDDDVWYTFTTPVGATIIQYVNTNISGNSDRVHQVYSGSSCGALTSIGCFDPESGSFTGLMGNTTYYLRTYTWGSSVTTTFNLCLRVPPPPPANDECAGAISLPVSSGSICNMATNGTTTNATQSIPASPCFGTPNDDVWYSFVATNSQHVVTVVGASGFDAVVNVRSGACNGTSIACADATGSGGTEVVNLNSLTVGSTYLVRVYHWSSAISSNPNFTICVTTPVPPCSAPGTPTSSGVGTTSATINWSAAPGGTLYRYSFGTGSHTCGSGSMTTSNTFVSLSGLTPNTTYTFCVRTDVCGGGAASSYVSNTFTTQPLPNDNCSGAIPVSCNQTVNGSTIGATTDSGMGACGVGTGGTPNLGVWYRLNGDGSQVTLNLCNSNYDTKVHVYEGSSCGSLSCVASNDDSGICSPSTRSHLIFNTNAGSTYYILVSGFASATGSFSMQIGCVCGAPLGTPWTSSAIGTATGEAIDNVCGGSIDLSGTGPAFSNADNLYYSHQTICGDQTITVKVAGISNGGHAGLMFRESTAPGSRMVSISTQLTYIILRRFRAMTNGNAQLQQIMRFGHNYLRLVRTGNIFQGFTSPDGNQWFIAFQVTLPLPTCVDAGIFVHGLNQASTATAVFQDLQMSGGQSPPTMGNNPYTGVSTDSPMTAFPNPASEQLNLKTGDLFLGQDLEITVINSMGQIVKSIQENNLRSDVLTLDVRDLTSGVYFLNVVPGNGSPYIQRFVIAR